MRRLGLIQGSLEHIWVIERVWRRVWRVGWRWLGKFTKGKGDQRERK